MGELFLISLLSMTGLALLFAGVLAFAENKLRVHEDPKLERLVELLPGVNCGACGFLSCHDFAEHILSNGADPAKCRVMHEETRKEVFELIGKEEEEVFRRIAIVHCAATWGQKKRKGEYKGVGTCGAANLLFGGGMECQYGCMGYGDCVGVCPFDAIHMADGLPVVDLDKCTGCGKCAEACPRKIIDMQTMRFEKLFYVACSSHDDMMRTRKVCGVGCIACGICVKLSQGELFEMQDNLSKAVYIKQADTEKVKPVQTKCPTKVIKDV